MKTILINGQESQINSAGMGTLGELVELIKGMIDPEHMITEIRLDGNELGDADWSSGMNKFAASTLEVETGAPADYVADRLSLSPKIVDACMAEFSAARELFHNGQMQEGNRRLAQAVAALKAFFEWYSTLMNVLPEPNRAAFSIDVQLSALMTTAKKICQQQMYQSWWAIGETIKTELEPELQKLMDHCQSFSDPN